MPTARSPNSASARSRRLGRLPGSRAHRQRGGPGTSTATSWPR